jgi:small-conductance mechanosensitive channel
LPGSGFDTYESQDKVLVQMDGSRECAVAVRILQQQGFAVAGAAVRLAAEQTADAESAKKAAEALGIECIVLNAEALAGQDADVLGEGGTPLFAALLLVGFSISSRRHFTRFLERSSARVGKVTQDHFWLTLRTVFWSILVASPLPVLWMTLGYGLQSAWPFPLAVAIGDGVTATVPLLWVVMICATFARPNGLFIAHFGWPRSRVAKAMRYYLMSIGLIVPLIMALIMFDNLNDREFSASLGRLCFLLIVLAVFFCAFLCTGIDIFFAQYQILSHNAFLLIVIVCAKLLGYTVKYRLLNI